MKPSPLRASLGPAATFGLIQTGGVFFWIHDAVGEGWLHMTWVVGGLTFALGVCFWRMLARRPCGISTMGGLVAGMLTSVLLHPTFWLPLALFLGLQENAGGVEMAKALGGGATLGLITFFLALPFLGICMIAGACWGYWQSQSLSPPEVVTASPEPQ